MTRMYKVELTPAPPRDSDEFEQGVLRAVETLYNEGSRRASTRIIVNYCRWIPDRSTIQRARTVLQNHGYTRVPRSPRALDGKWLLERENPAPVEDESQN